jgi:CubicO group peptidase (beta-lactamase class C family)
MIAALLLAMTLDAAAEGKIDAAFAELAGTRTPGCAVGIMRGEELVFARGYGMASLEHHVAITPRSVFGLQSTSKQFVAMGILLLIQDGRLAFEDDVRKYVPELPDYGEPITIRHLLDHTSGLRDVAILVQNQGWKSEDVYSRAQVLRLIARQKSLNHPPGAAASYTNTGYFLLPLVAERITGEPFAAFLERRVFLPLGMRDTVYRDEVESVIARRVSAYGRDARGAWRMAGNNKYTVFTTVEDLARWNANFARPTVGGADAIREMTTWGKLRTGETTAWGLGLSPLRYRGLDGLYFSGGGVDGTSVLARFPEQSFAVSVLCNATMPVNAEVYAQKVIDAVLAEKIAAAVKPAEPPEADPAPVPIARTALQPLAGLYFTTEGGPRTREIRVAGDTLQLVLGEEQRNLIPLGKGRFRVAGSSTEYVLDGRTARRIVADEPVLTFTRVDATKPAKLDEFVGIFYNAEVEADLTLTVSDGRLRYAMRHQDVPTSLEPVFRDTFADGGLFFRFQRDSRGRVTGVTTHWDRVWEMLYTKR